MKKLNLAAWNPVPPSLAFAGEGVSTLEITWPDYNNKKEYIDPLTGAPNRRAFDEVANMAVEISNRQGSGFGLILLDIDHFKKINDTYGHSTGDAALQTFVAITHSTLRNEDFFARIGGEEFAVITPAWDMVFDIGERIRRAVASKNFNINEGTSIKVTCSFGCAAHPKDAFDFKKLFDLADKALYEAKNTGRNKGMKGGE